MILADIVKPLLFKKHKYESELACGKSRRMGVTLKYILSTTKFGVSVSSMSQLSVTHKALRRFVEDYGLFNTMGE